MTFKQKLIYFWIAVCLFIVFAFISFFGAGYIVSLISDDWRIRLIVNILLILVINPLIVQFIMEKLPFKIKGLKKQERIDVNKKPSKKEKDKMPNE